MSKGFYIKYVVERVCLEWHFLFCTITIILSLSLPCCQSSYFPHSIKRAIIGKAVAVSLSLVYIYGCPVALGICVFK